MDIKLTEGAMERILGGDIVDKPIVQILSYKRVPGSQDRYRMLVSDGRSSYPFCMLATQLNDRLDAKEFEKYTVIKLDKYSCTEMQPGRKIIIMLEITLVAKGDNVGKRLGNPQNFGEGAGGKATSGQDTGGNEASNHVNGASNVNGHAKNEPVEAPVIKQEPLSNSSISNSIPKPNTSNSFASIVKSENNFNPIRPAANDPKLPFGAVHSINSISPFQNNWVIKARVTFKQPIKTWSNSRGEGRLFNMNLVDESGEIRATVFTDLVDKYYNMMELNKVYFIKKAATRAANKRFSNVNHDYELQFNRETEVVECPDEETASIPMVKYDFQDIASLQNIDPSTFTVVDVIGVCKSYGDITTIMQKTTNKELKKRELHLVDKSLAEITLTLWGETAEEFDGSFNPVVAVKGARLSDFGGRSLSTLMSSTVSINPDIREAHALRGWYDREGAHANTQSMTKMGGMASGQTNWKTFAQVQAEKLGFDQKPDYFTCKAMVLLIKKDSCLYQACPSENCNKKVQDLQDGNYRCEKCQKEFQSYKWKMLGHINIADFTDTIWATSFQENSEAILGVTAEELGRMKLSDEAAFGDVLTNAQFKSYIFKIRAKAETWNEEERVKYAVVNVQPMNFVEHGNKLLADIKNLEALLPK